MKSKKLREQNFLFASNIDNPKVFFQGYCFVDTDYIFGDKGREKFHQQTGLSIKGGEDGCYVTVQSTGNTYSFSSDFYGYKKLFYYWTPDIWVVSNSIFLICEHLKKSNIFIRANYSQLSTVGIHRSLFFNQIYCTNTIVENIKLLPVGFELDISKFSYMIKKIENKFEIDSYKQGLSSFISVWTARLAGLIKYGIDIQSDLTGGIDSRTVFTVLKKATEMLEEDAKSPVLRSGATNDNKDLTIATMIAENYGFPINKRNLSISNKFSGEESFFSWKSLCLGVYHPIYFPSYGPQPSLVALAGGGAENHRLFYKYEDAEAFIRANAARIEPDWLSNNFEAEMHSEMQRMSSTGSKVDLMTRHYREYRNRMHAGRSPQYVSSFNPLASKILDETAEFAGLERLKAGQVSFDIMASLLPSIFDIPFDSPSKALNELRRSNLTIIREWEVKNIGRVFINTIIDDSIPDKTANAFELLNDDFQSALDRPFVKNFFGKEFIVETNSLMIEAKNNRRFSHAIDGQAISAVIAAAMFD